MFVMAHASVLISFLLSLIVLSGIPGCAKSALCEELLNAPGGLGDDRPVHSLMGDRIKGISYCSYDAFLSTLVFAPLSLLNSFFNGPLIVSSMQIIFCCPIFLKYILHLH